MYYQMSIFDLLPQKESHIISKDCFRCLYYESHRCRNQRFCPDGMRYEEYTGSTIRQCLYATIELFQDGYVHCPVIDCIGCEVCMEKFGDGSGYLYDESQNYERLPRYINF